MGGTAVGVRELQNNSAFVGIIQNGIVKIATDPMMRHVDWLAKQGALASGKVMEGVRVFTVIKNSVGEMLWCTNAHDRPMIRG